MTDIAMDCKQDIGKGSVEDRCTSHKRSIFLFFHVTCLGLLSRLLLSDFSSENGGKTALDSFLVEFKTRRMSVSR